MDSIPIGRHSHHHHNHNYPPSNYDKSMTDSNNLYSVWNNFFLSAGIPPSVANEYAVTFSQHRIQIDMLKEITKEILLDMGIKAMGDIIAILRHAKQLCTQDELKSGGLVTSKTSSTVVNNIVNQPSSHHHQHQPPPPQPQPSSIAPNNLSQRTPISSARLSGPTILSSVGGKIQSRLSLNSGALRASLGPIDSTSAPTSTVASRSLSTSSLTVPRQRGGPNAIANSRPLPEKTLTVRYPSVAAMERVKQHQRGLGSIKSRLDSGGGSTSNQQQQQQHRASKELQGTLRNGHQTGTRPVSHFTSNTHKQNNHRREDGHVTTSRYANSNGRLKSTVFNRLGEGPR